MSIRSSSQQVKSVAPLLMAGLVAMSVFAPEGHAEVVGTPGHIQVEVVGTGRPVLMIPGLNSSAEVWRDTCTALHVQCHLVQLPGFAGAAAADPRATDFLPAMRDELLAYVREQTLEKPAVVGHSLGGVLALQMAIKAPGTVGPLVIVDSLPFYAAIQNPNATADSVAPMAAQMRKGMLAADDTSYQAQADAAMKGMTTDAARLPELLRWGRASDRQTTADAMHSMLVHDLRGELGAIRSPVLVLGSWAAYQAFGATEASTKAVFQGQYAKLDGVRIEMSRTGHHFLMWDDPQWLQTQVAGFLADAR